MWSQRQTLWGVLKHGFIWSQMQTLWGVLKHSFIWSQMQTLWGVLKHSFIWSQMQTLWGVLKHTFTPADTVQYPEQQPALFPRYRGRIVLTRDPDGEERCVACNLCAAACPVDCIALQKAEDPSGRWYPEFFRINFSRCILCGFCEEACPTYAIQLTPDFELCEYDRRNLVYEKEHLLIQGTGKYPGYSFWQVAGKAIAGKDKGEAENEDEPIDVKSLLP